MGRKGERRGVSEKGTGRDGYPNGVDAIVVLGNTFCSKRAMLY